MSLAQPAMHSSTAGSNPFGPNAILGSDRIERPVSCGRSSASPSAPLSAPPGGIHAPQGRVPVTLPTILPHSAAVRPESRPDFTVGFGLDIPEEEEPVEVISETSLLRGGGKFSTEDVDTSQEDNLQQADDLLETGDLDGLTTASQSRYHSRHVSRLSGALSLRDVGGLENNDLSEEEDMVPLRSPIRNEYIDDLDQDAVGEWTGSEDLYMDNESSSDEVRLFMPHSPID